MDSSRVPNALRQNLKKNVLGGIERTQMRVYSQRLKGPKRVNSVQGEDNETWESDSNCIGGWNAVCQRVLGSSRRLCRQRSGRGQECIRASVVRSVCQIDQPGETPDVHGRQSGGRPLHREQPASG